MTRAAVRLVVMAGSPLAALAFAARPARAEPMLLARQYARCNACHYSPTGGGLLTRYGRSLSRELSTTGHRTLARPGERREEDVLWGLLGDRLGALDLGVDARPTHLRIRAETPEMNHNFWMTADLMAAYRSAGWTVYGQVGRLLGVEETKIDSYEYWIAHETRGGLGVRAGRFLPAFGVRLADHTALTRKDLGFDVYDQVFGVEVSGTGDRHLWQLSVGPGHADSILHDDGRRAFTATGRLQRDLGPRSTLVVSGRFRDNSSLAPWTGMAGVAYGWAPTRRLSLWTEADAPLKPGTWSSPALTVMHEAAVEVFRGAWLKLSPQLQTRFGSASVSLLRMSVEANLLPRTHWNLGVSYYWHWDRVRDEKERVVIAQVHLY